MLQTDENLTQTTDLLVVGLREVWCPWNYGQKQNNSGASLQVFSPITMLWSAILGACLMISNGLRANRLPNEQLIGGQLFAMNGSQENASPKPIELPIYYDPDSDYYVEMKVGIPPQTFKVQIGTKSSDTWILSKEETQHSGLRTRAKYDRSISSSFRTADSDFALYFSSDNYIEGDHIIEQITLGNLTLPNRIIGAIQIAELSLFDVMQFDGTLGLGTFNINQRKPASIVVDLFKHGLVPEPIFSIHLKKNQSESPAGTLVIGGVGSSTLFNGNLTYSPLANSWNEFRIDRVLVQIEPISSLHDHGGEAGEHFGLALVDPTINVIAFHQAESINRKLGATERAANGFYKFADCNTENKPYLAFQTSFRNLVFTPSEYILNLSNEDDDELDYNDCYSILVDDLSFGRSFTFGTPFIRKYFSVFDYAQNRMKFAESV